MLILCLLKSAEFLGRTDESRVADMKYHAVVVVVIVVVVGPPTPTISPQIYPEFFCAASTLISKIAVTEKTSLGG